MTLHRMKIDIY